MAEVILGIDVGKHQLHVALLVQERKPKLKAVANSADGHQTLLKWLQQQGIAMVHACLESTSTYGEAIAEALYLAGHQVSIVNPARIKAAILSMAKSCSSPRNACTVRTSEKAKRARTVERTGVV
jgi:transposase